MDRLSFLQQSACLFFFVLLGGISSGARKPNIVVILADDLGYSDLGCYGGEIETPRLDELARGGVRMSNFYNAGRCCPTRASLLTGLYPHQAGVGFMIYADWGPGYEGSLNENGVTLAEALKEGGYQTMTVGKWHVAAHRSPPAYSLPENRGFDRSTVVRTHIDSYWKVLKGCDIYQDGKLLIEGDSENESLMNPLRPEREFYTTEYFTDVALKYLDEAMAEKEKPFFLYLAYNAPHFPLEAPDQTIAKYEEKFGDPDWVAEFGEGWDEQREKKLIRQKKLGVVPPGQTLPEIHYFNNKRVMPGLQTGVEFGVLPKWRDLPGNVQEEMLFRRAIYNAQIDNMDENIGRVIDQLKENGALENTLILFLSDNGCSGEMGVFGTHFAGGKYDYTEGRFEDGKFIPGGEKENDAWSTRDKVGGVGYGKANYHLWKKASGWATSNGQGWASYSNSPFRKYKKFAHEGGIATPLIAHWPAKIKKGEPRAGDGGFHVIDIMPTLLEAAGVDYPADYNGRSRLPLEGVSMMPGWMNGRSKVPERTLFWQHETHAAVRRGEWKAVTDNDRGKPITWELYDLRTDRSETKNLAGDHPELVAELDAAWQKFARRAQVMPFPENRKPGEGD